MKNKSVEEKIVDDIIGDLTDRGGLSNEWDNIDGEIQDEIREEWMSIVKTHINKEHE